MGSKNEPPGPTYHEVREKKDSNSQPPEHSQRPFPPNSKEITTSSPQSATEMTRVKKQPRSLMSLGVTLKPRHRKIKIKIKNALQCHTHTHLDRPIVDDQIKTSGTHTTNITCKTHRSSSYSNTPAQKETYTPTNYPRIHPIQATPHAANQNTTHTHSITHHPTRDPWTPNSPPRLRVPNHAPHHRQKALKITCKSTSQRHLDNNNSPESSP